MSSKKYILLFALLITFSLQAQEKKNSFRIGGSIAYFLKIEKQKFDPFSPPEGYYNFPLSPGAEIIYSRLIFSGVELCTGINFQKVHVSSFVDYIRIFRYKEISIPLILKKNFRFKNKNNWFLTIGVYVGRQKSIQSDIPLSSGWQDWNDISSIAHYSDDYTFTDIYFDTGYSHKLNNRSELSFTPFVKYRANSTWLNYHQNKFHCGIKLNYLFKF